MKVRCGVVAKRPSGRGSPSPSGRNGGRAWWAHFEFTRINIEPIILRKRSRSCVSWARSSSARAGLVNPTPSLDTYRRLSGRQPRVSNLGGCERRL